MRIIDWSSDVCSSDLENVQAGLRTDYLVRLANRHQGLVVGTGDLSELALGWCTYGVGDQMSHYGVNAGVPKTLIQFLIRWAIKTDQYDAETDAVLGDILAAEISPALVHAGDDGAEIGSASCRERVCQYVSISVAAVPSKQNPKPHPNPPTTPNP